MTEITVDQLYRQSLSKLDPQIRDPFDVFVSFLIQTGFYNSDAAYQFGIDTIKAMEPLSVPDALKIINTYHKSIKKVFNETN
jgi:hypothetical protein